MELKHSHQVQLLASCDTPVHDYFTMPNQVMTSTTEFPFTAAERPTAHTLVSHHQKLNLAPLKYIFKESSCIECVCNLACANGPIMEDHGTLMAHMWVEKPMKAIFTLFMLQFLAVI